MSPRQLNRERSIRGRSALWGGALLISCAILIYAAPAAADSPTPADESGASSSAVASALAGAIDAGTLAALRWPNFIDYRTHVRNFYGPSPALAWTRGAAPTAAALALIQQLEQADLKGLRAEDYDGGRWSARVARLRQSAPPPAATDLAGFDLALTVCLMRYLSDLHIGRVNPKTVNFNYAVNNKKYDLVALLREKFVNADPADVPTLVADVEPPFPAYRRVEKALQLYMGLAARAPALRLPPPEGVIDPGDEYPDLPALVGFLRLVGDLAPDAVVPLDPPLYEQPVVDAVKHFQMRHGLDSDGRLGPETVKELNVPLSWRVEQLRLTLERWRWRPLDLPRPPIVVNIPAFTLRALGADYVPEVQMRVVVGKAFHHKTPVFTANLTYVVFRPYWNVPLSITRKELVPKLRRDPGYLVKGNYEITTRDGALVTDDAVSDAILAGLSPGRLLIRQKPGPRNSLGLVKFMFPNEYNVYLHDTPTVTLFARSRRDFSHGCIRVQDPVALAVWVLRDNPGWDRDRVIATMNGTTDNLEVTLKHPIPVLIVYGTAVAPPDGTVHFFRDIYGYDAELEKVLFAGYPFP